MGTGGDTTTVRKADERIAAESIRRSLGERLSSWLRDHATPVNWIVSIVAAGLMLWAAFQWWERASDLASPCAAVGLSAGICNEVPEFLQGFQFVLAIFGIAAGVAAAALSLVQAILARKLTFMKYAVGLLLGSAVLWVAVYWYGRIFF